MLDQNLIKKKFKQIGTDVTFKSFHRHRSFRLEESSLPVTVDVKTVKGKEVFEIIYDTKTEFDLAVIDIRPQERHLLLMVKQHMTNSKGTGIDEIKLKLLCGHDERHYFACGIPEDAGVSTVQEAKRALLPPEFIEAHQKIKGKARSLLKRKNEAGFRQGEWLFVKDISFTPDNPLLIKRNEPISRGGGSKPHICEQVYTVGGETVYVHPQYAPNGISEGEMSRIKQQLQQEGVTGRIDFEVRTRDALVYARGDVRHPDHKTIHLSEWHRVYMNTEHQSKASKFSVFLD